MEYVVLTTNDPSPIAFMSTFGTDVVSVHTEPSYIIWVWHNATSEKMLTVQDQAWVVGISYISG